MQDVSRGQLCKEAAAPRLRLFCGHESSDEGDRRPEDQPGGGAAWPPELVTSGPTVRWTLRQFYDGYVLPVCLEPRGVSPLTVREDRQALRYWACLVGDPPLEEINQTVCADFLRRLAWFPGRPCVFWPEGDFISPNTLRKHCRHLQRMFALAGPSGPGNRLGADLLERVPWLEAPSRDDHEAEAVFTLDEIGQWIDVCDQAITPPIPGVPPPDFWRALVVWTANVGTRIASTIQIEWSMIQEGRGGWWLHAPGRVMKRGRARKLFVNRPALEAARSIRRADRRVFPWPYTLDYLHKARVRLLARSEIPAARRFGFHALRRTLATELAAVNAIVAQKQMGHTAISVTRDSYVHASAMVDAMQRIKQPVAKGPAIRAADRQLRLF